MQKKQSSHCCQQVLPGTGSACLTSSRWKRSAGAVANSHHVKFLRDSAYQELLESVTFWATVCKTVHRMLSDRCLSILSVCNVGVLWPNGWMD